MFWHLAASHFFWHCWKGLVFVSATKLMQASNTTYCDLAADWMNNTGGGYCGGTLNGIINHLDYIEVRNMSGRMPLNSLPSLMQESSILVLLPQSDSDDKLLWLIWLILWHWYSDSNDSKLCHIFDLPSLVWFVLDFVQGMGFDCIWITPVVDSNGFMGYDAENIFEIEPHFGSKDMHDCKAGSQPCCTTTIISYTYVQCYHRIWVMNMSIWELALPGRGLGMQRKEEAGSRIRHKISKSLPCRDGYLFDKIRGYRHHTKKGSKSRIFCKNRCMETL